MANSSFKWFKVCNTLESLPQSANRAKRKHILECLFAGHRKGDPDVRAGRSKVASGHFLISPSQFQVAEPTLSMLTATFLINVRAFSYTGEHMYGLIRLLLPMIDRDENRTNVLYHMKER